jgi:hypothetical protein
MSLKGGGIYRSRCIGEEKKECRYDISQVGWIVIVVLLYTKINGSQIMNCVYDNPFACYAPNADISTSKMMAGLRNYAKSEQIDPLLRRVEDVKHLPRLRPRSIH